MELHQALGPATAGLGGVEARVEAVLVDTGFVERTVSVSTTLGSVALRVRIASVALRTGADRVVGPGGALGLGGARVADNARVYTVLVDTGFTLRTVWVLSTLGPRLDGVAAGEWISSEARATVTGGTVRADLTHGVTSTRVGSNARIDTSSVLTDLSVRAV